MKGHDGEEISRNNIKGHSSFSIVKVMKEKKLLENNSPVNIKTDV
jgi:hypothetical protein